MANFEPAFSTVYALEGIYDNDPDDTGGETAFGVSRNNFPNWKGWIRIDQLKDSYQVGSKDFINALKGDSDLYLCVKQWYKENFWDKFELDSLTSQTLALEIFDCSVNTGVGKATEFIQKAFNAFNYNLKFGADLLVDGKIGPNTRMKLVEIGNNVDYIAPFRKAIDGLQAAHYINLGQKANSSYRKYMRGWLINRVG